MAEIHSVIFLSDNTVAEGRASGELYSFEIVTHLRDLGYKAIVKDCYPAKDGEGYYWYAAVEPWNPTIISSKEYSKMTNMSGLSSWNVRFEVEEMQEILIAHGYEIVLHTGKCEVNGVTHDGGEVRKTGEKWVENRKIILAVKPEERDNLPEWITSYRAGQLRFETQFNNLMKAKLSNPSWGK